jgi:DNA-binding response OmpR family regulator
MRSDPARIGERLPLKISISSEKALVHIGEREIPLLPKQYLVLVLLARNRGRVVRYLQILHECWGDNYGTEDMHILQIAMSRLRHRLGDVGGRGKISRIIRTHWDTGYELIAEVEGWPCISENDMTVHIDFKGKHFTGTLKRTD